MAHDAARGWRTSRFHSSGSERGDRSERSDRSDRNEHGHASPAVDYVVGEEDEDLFYDFDRGRDDGLSSLADELIDGLVPPEIDWRIIVRRHPLPALLVAGVGGYLLGRSQGSKLVRAISALAVARVESEVLGRIDDELG